MKVIFLDVDGVLNDQNLIFEKFKTKEIEISKDKLLLLKKIITSNDDIKVVLSSSWRIGLLKKDGKIVANTTYHKEFLELLKEYSIQIYDITPSMMNRPEEIKYYLDNNDIESYVILDDEDLNDENQVKTDFFNGGLTEEHVPLAIDILKRKKR